MSFWNLLCEAALLDLICKFFHLNGARLNRVATTRPSVAAMHSMTPIIQEITRRTTIVRQAIILADILAHGTTASTTTLSTMHFSTTSKTLSDIIFRFVVPFCRFFDLKGEPRHGSCCLKFLKTYLQRI